jgi:hypothetical protein
MTYLMQLERSRLARLVPGSLGEMAQEGRGGRDLWLSLLFFFF